MSNNCLQVRGQSAGTQNPRAPNVPSVGTISVIIPVWNRADTIASAIDSVMAQRSEEAAWSLQVIVVDDGSTDDLARVLQPYGDRITCIRHSTNRGAAAARNSGIAAASGDLLAFLDSDDVWLPGKLAAQIAFMQASGYAATCTACHLARRGALDLVWPHYRTGAVARTDLLWGCFLSPGTTMLCRPRVFDEVGVFDTELPRHEDWDWLLRLTARHELGYLAEPLARREPSPYANAREVLNVLAKLETKHLASLSAREGRYFKAALWFEAGAAHYRQGDRLKALRELTKSVWMAPLGHAGLRTILTSRLQWR
jgi:glycosyltransferase involved in cell wall biosynthesis